MNTQIFVKRQTVNCGGKLLDLSTPAVMGILNVTPDSFYAGSRISDDKAFVERAEAIISEGGAIIDLGAYSSRPGASDVPADEEYRRLRPALALLRKHFPAVFVSVDTFRAEIVHKLYDEFGAFIVNDISAGEFDGAMLSTVGKLGLPCIAMHLRGTLATMHNDENCQYKDLVTEVVAYFVDKKKRMLDAGITDIIIDPGFGFSKTLAGNYELLAGVGALKILELPVLAGLSRKSMFYRMSGVAPDEALSATIAGNMVALQQGADILRVHDVRAAVDTVKVFSQLKKYTT
jgi:dihydropteroate synthase